MNVNVLQSVNSFMGQFGLAISSPKQILAKVTTVAFAAILLAGNLPSVSANCGVDCLNACPLRSEDPSGYSRCAQACIIRCFGR